MALTARVTATPGQRASVFLCTVGGILFTTGAILLITCSANEGAVIAGSIILSIGVLSMMTSGIAMFVGYAQYRQRQATAWAAEGPPGQPGAPPQAWPYPAQTGVRYNSYPTSQAIFMMDVDQGRLPSGSNTYVLQTASTMRPPPPPTYSVSENFPKQEVLMDAPPPYTP